MIHDFLNVRTLFLVLHGLIYRDKALVENETSTQFTGCVGSDPQI